jgi:hypothetical protein
MLIGTRDSFVNIERWEDDSYSIIAHYAGFHGSSGEVWIFRDQADRFLNELTSLEQNRTGKAVLSSASSDQFYVEFFNLDRLGHIGVKANLPSYSLLHGESYQLLVSVTFEIDPTSLPSLLREFKKLFIR